MNWLLIPAVFCLASFCWAMQCHFVRGGKFTRGMTVTVLAGLLSTALHLTGLARHQAGWPLVALLLYAAAAALFWSAIRATRGAGLTACFLGQTARQVVTRGPYRRIRHPFYTAYSLVWLAGYVATLWWPTAVAFAVMLLLYVKAARAEERDWLGGEQWEEYAAYVRQTGGLLPRLTKKT